MIKKTSKLVWLLWLDQKTTVRLLINMYMSMYSQIYHYLVKFCKQNQVIVTQINAIWSFAWGWKRSPRRFCSCSIWSCKVIALTKAKLLGLKGNSVWAVLHASLDLLPVKFHQHLMWPHLKRANRVLQCGQVSVLKKNVYRPALLWLACLCICV